MFFRKEEMSNPNTHIESITHFPALLGSDEQWLSDMEYIRKNQVEMIQLSQLERKEVERLRVENSNLKKQLDLVMNHPLFDDQSERINVSMELWQLQKSRLKKLNIYRKQSYILSVVTLILMVIVCYLLI